eukprot:maker-scaffold220_size252247-snap-gene-1.25 protein:Tk01524 transcript:maker-scaffold220_size252247-snap-gene-1.25-mRNA-1 annotation:"PREDICTED: uncharacterized protein LOC101236374"
MGANRIEASIQTPSPSSIPGDVPLSGSFLGGRSTMKDTMGLGDWGERNPEVPKDAQPNGTCSSEEKQTLAQVDMEEMQSLIGSSGLSQAFVEEKFSQFTSLTDMRPERGMTSKQFYKHYQRAYPRSVQPLRLANSLFRWLDQDHDGILYFREFFTAFCVPSAQQSPETLCLMEARNRATGKEYKRLRNRVSSLVKPDKLRTSLLKLQEANGDPKVIWQLANDALGNQQTSLPASLIVDGVHTVGKTEGARVLNDFYIQKVKKLRDNLHSTPSSLASLPTSEWPKLSAPFHFSFANAGRLAKSIMNLKSKDVLGLDRIPVSVLKKGVDIRLPTWSTGL